MTLHIDWRLIALVVVFVALVMLSKTRTPPQREAAQLVPFKPIRRKSQDDSGEQEASQDSSAPATMTG